MHNKWKITVCTDACHWVYNKQWNLWRGAEQAMTNKSVCVYFSKKFGRVTWTQIYAPFCYRPLHWHAPFLPKQLIGCLLAHDKPFHQILCKSLRPFGSLAIGHSHCYAPFQPISINTNTHLHTHTRTLDLHAKFQATERPGSIMLVNNKPSFSGLRAVKRRTHHAKTLQKTGWWSPVSSPIVSFADVRCEAKVLNLDCFITS